MYHDHPSPRFPSRTLLSLAVAVGLNAAMLGTLLNQPTRGETLLVAEHPLAMPVLAGETTFSALKAGFRARFAHAARDLRHAERNVLRGLHHGARAVGALVSWSGTPATAAPTCLG